MGNDDGNMRSVVPVGGDGPPTGKRETPKSPSNTKKYIIYFAGAAILLVVVLIVGGGGGDDDTGSKSKGTKKKSSVTHATAHDSHNYCRFTFKSTYI